MVPTPRWRMLKSQEPAPATSPWLQRELTPFGKRTTWLFRMKIKREQKESFTTWVLSGSPPGKRQATSHPESTLPAGPASWTTAAPSKPPGPLWPP